MLLKHLAMNILCIIPLLSVDFNVLDEFDDNVFKDEQFENIVQDNIENEQSPLTGSLSEQINYSYRSEEPHDKVSSLRSFLYMDYNQIVNNNIKIRINMKAYYDLIYDLKGRKKFTLEELNELEKEIELFDAYLESSVTDNLDIRIGRQILVWGRSDTLRVVDVLNPIDNRRPGIVDIKDLRLPVAMLKLDYFFTKNWHITPVLILEQRFTKEPPFGSKFYPENFSPQPVSKKYSDITYAMSLSGEFDSWDISFYFAKTRNSNGHIELHNSQAITKYELIEMKSVAVNYLNGSWLFKSEFAHKEDIKYTLAPDKEFNSWEVLLGTEYYGFKDTVISYDGSYKRIGNYVDNLILEPISVEENTYLHALRVKSEFLNSTIIVNYLATMDGIKLENGGYQRFWTEFKMSDTMYFNIGILDFFKGSQYFNSISNNDMLFAEIKYSF